MFVMPSNWLDGMISSISGSIPKSKIRCNWKDKQIAYRKRIKVRRAKNEQAKQSRKRNRAK